MPITPEIAAAIEELVAQHSDATVTAIPDGDGGAFVTVDKVALSDKFEPQETWVKFHITVNYPASDVYPHFVRPDLRLSGGDPQAFQGLGDGTSLGDFKFANQDLRAIQISRRSNHLDPSIDTAALKLAKVLAFLEGGT